MNLRPIIENTYTHLIKATLDRILFFDLDSIMDFIISLHVAEPKDAAEKIIVSEKFLVTREFWKAILEQLHEEYLPNRSYTFDWSLEVTPYSLLLCELTKDGSTDLELERVKLALGVTDEDIESDFQSIAAKLGLDKLGLGNGLAGLLPDRLLPKSQKEHLQLLFRLMNFPPLAELSYFLGSYESKVKQQRSKLEEAFSEVGKAPVPTIAFSEPMHYSYFHVSHTALKAHGIHALAGAPELADEKGKLERIAKEAEKQAPEYKDELLCPCCGKPHEITLPAEILQYKMLLQDKALSRKVGLYFYEEFKTDFKKSIAERFQRFVPDINKVESPDCLILVEGDSEEVAIPIIALRSGFVLASSNIQVYNSKSKQKLLADFMSFRSKYPNRKMICLLDADAVKEKQDMERLIKDNRNKYHLVFISRGTFEDIFDLNTAVEVLNDLYPEGDPLDVNDFEAKKNFVTNVERLMFVKKKAKFDKVLFAKTISFKVDPHNLPAELSEVIEKAKEFSTKGKFIKR